MAACWLTSTNSVGQGLQSDANKDTECVKKPALVKPSDKPNGSSNMSSNTGKADWLRYAMKVSRAVLTAYWELSGASRDASTSW